MEKEILLNLIRSHINSFHYNEDNDDCCMDGAKKVSMRLSESERVLELEKILNEYVEKGDFSKAEKISNLLLDRELSTDEIKIIFAKYVDRNYFGRSEVFEALTEKLTMVGLKSLLEEYRNNLGIAVEVARLLDEPEKTIELRGLLMKCKKSYHKNIFEASRIIILLPEPERAEEIKELLKAIKLKSPYYGIKVAELLGRKLTKEELKIILSRQCEDGYLEEVENISKMMDKKDLDEVLEESLRNLLRNNKSETAYCNLEFIGRKSKWHAISKIVSYIGRKLADNEVRQIFTTCKKNGQSLEALEIAELLPEPEKSNELEKFVRGWFFFGDLLSSHERDRFKGIIKKMSEPKKTEWMNVFSELFELKMQESEESQEEKAEKEVCSDEVTEKPPA